MWSYLVTEFIVESESERERESVCVCVNLVTHSRGKGIW